MYYKLYKVCSKWIVESSLHTTKPKNDEACQLLLLTVTVIITVG